MKSRGERRAQRTEPVDSGERAEGKHSRPWFSH
jgi:hypothetical protein